MKINKSNFAFHFNEVRKFEAEFVSCKIVI